MKEQLFVPSIAIIYHTLLRLQMTCFSFVANKLQNDERFHISCILAHIRVLKQ